MNTQIPIIKTPQENDEISLWDVVIFLKEGWRWLAGGMLLGLACAVGYLLVAPKQYEAQALFVGAKVLGVDLEPTQQLIERLKFPTFYDNEQIKACDATPGMLAVNLAKRISPTILKGTSILQVTYRAPESVLAVHCLNAVMDRIIRSQNKMSEPILQNAKKQLALTQAQLAENERIQLMLEKRSMNTLDAADTKFSQTVLLLSATLSKKEEIQRLRKSALEQMASLEAPATRPAELLEPIYAPGYPLLPKKLPIIASGLLCGLALSGLAFFVRRSWLARRVV